MVHFTSCMPASTCPLLWWAYDEVMAWSIFSCLQNCLNLSDTKFMPAYELFSLVVKTPRTNLDYSNAVISWQDWTPFMACTVYHIVLSLYSCICWWSSHVTHCFTMSYTCIYIHPVHQLMHYDPCLFYPYIVAVQLLWYLFLQFKCNYYSFTLYHNAINHCQLNPYWPVLSLAVLHIFLYGQACLMYSISSCRCIFSFCCLYVLYECAYLILYCSPDCAHPYVHSCNLLVFVLCVVVAG